jgi:hypothetical protein
MSTVSKSIKNQDYVVADLSLAAWGRKEGGDAIFRATRGLVIDEAANDAKVGFHE